MNANAHRFEDTLAWARAQAPSEAEGFFGPNSMTWVLFREPTLLAGGLRAVALQLAHPLVALGVSRNSRFRNDVFGRAKRTFAAMYELVFSDVAEAEASARRVHALHAAVHGKAGPQDHAARGRPYHALFPDLQSWVMATCIDTSMLVYRTFVRDWEPGQREQYYRECHVLAALFGMPPGTLPATLTDFDAYIDDMLTGDQLIVDGEAREMADLLFNSPITRGPLDEILTAGLLPDRWRAAFGLRWGAPEQRSFRALVLATRAFNRAVPARVRNVTAWHQARYRIALAEGRRPSLYGRALNGLDHRIDLPFSIRPVGLHAPEEG